MRYLFTLIYLIITVNVFATDTSSNHLNIDSLLNKIESIENDLKKIKNSSKRNRLLDRGATINWGKGFNLGFNLYQPCNPSFNIGYNFSRQDESSKYELTDSKNMLLGLSFKGKIFAMSSLFVNDIDDQMAYSIGANMNISSPVLLNFISISAYIGPFIQWGEKDEYTEGITEVEIGLEFGNDINFWLTKATSISIGYMLDPTLGNIKGKRDLMNSTEMKFAYGFKHYFNKKSKV